MTVILIGQDPRLNAVYIRKCDPRDPERDGMLFIPVELRGDTFSGYAHSIPAKRTFGPVRIKVDHFERMYDRDNRATELLRMNSDAMKLDLSNLGKIGPT